MGKEIMHLPQFTVTLVYPDSDYRQLYKRHIHILRVCPWSMQLLHIPTPD